MTGPDTEELGAVPAPAPDGRPDDERVPGKRRNWGRGLTGSLAVGLVVLAVVVLGSGVLAVITGGQGPGPLALIAHPVAAVAALAAQHVVDRRRGFLAGVAVAAILAITGAALWFLWWN